MPEVAPGIWVVEQRGEAAAELGHELERRLAEDDLGACVGRNRGRSVWRVERPGSAPLFIKHFDGPAGATTAAREWKALFALAARGLRGPGPVLLARRADGAAALIASAVAGRELDLEPGRLPARELGRALRTLHDAGIAHRQLFAWHLLVDVQGGVGFIDLAEAHAGDRPVGTKARARDLAALFVTLARRQLSLVERSRLLAAYEPGRRRRRELLVPIRRALLRWRRRGRVPRTWPHREWRDAGQRLLVAESYATRAADDGAVTAARWLEAAGVLRVRERDGRANLRWDRPLGGADDRPWFGKRHAASPWFGRAPAFAEFLAHRALDALGIPVAPVVAVARQEGGRSVLWTRGIRPGMTLRERLLARPALPPASRRSLLGAAIDITRRLHAAGFCHRDLYLDHLLLEEHAGGTRLVLIDLGRLEEHVLLPTRRRVKDLAALDSSARAAGVSRAERWRALLAYSRGDRRAATRLAPAIVRKADRILARERRHGRLPASS